MLSHGRPLHCGFAGKFVSHVGEEVGGGGEGDVGDGLPAVGAGVGSSVVDGVGGGGDGDVGEGLAGVGTGVCSPVSAS